MAINQAESCALTNIELDVSNQNQNVCKTTNIELAVSNQKFCMHRTQTSVGFSINDFYLPVAWIEPCSVKRWFKASAKKKKKKRKKVSTHVRLTWVENFLLLIYIMNITSGFSP